MGAKCITETYQLHYVISKITSYNNYFKISLSNLDSTPTGKFALFELYPFGYMCPSQEICGQDDLVYLSICVNTYGFYIENFQCNLHCKFSM